MRINEPAPVVASAPLRASERTDLEYIRDGVELVTQEAHELERSGQRWEAAFRGSVAAEVGALALTAADLALGGGWVATAACAGLVGLAGAGIGYTAWKVRQTSLRLDETQALLSRLQSTQMDLASRPAPGGYAPDLRAVLGALKSCPPEGVYSLLSASAPTLNLGAAQHPELAGKIVSSLPLQGYSGNETLPLLQICSHSCDPGVARLAQMALDTRGSQASFLVQMGALHAVWHKKPWPQSLLHASQVALYTSSSDKLRLSASTPYFKAISTEPGLAAATQLLAGVAQGGSEPHTQVLARLAAEHHFRTDSERPAGQALLQAAQYCLEAHGEFTSDVRLQAAGLFLAALVQQGGPSAALAGDFLKTGGRPDSLVIALKALMPMLERLEKTRA